MFLSQVVEGEGTEVASPAKVSPAGEISSKLNENNGVNAAGDGDLILDSSSLNKEDQGNKDLRKAVTDSGKTETESQEIDKDVKELDSSMKSEKASKKRGRKRSTSLKHSRTDDTNRDDEKDAEKISNHDKNQSTVPSSLDEDPTSEAVPLEKGKESDAPASPNKDESEANIDLSSARREDSHDEKYPKKAGRGRKKGVSRDAATSTDAKAKKASEVTNDTEGRAASETEGRSHRRSGKKVPAKVSDEDMGCETVETSKDNNKSNLEVKAKESSKKDVIDSSVKEDREERKKRRGKGIVIKDTKQFAGEDDKKSSLKDEFKVSLSVLYQA